MSRNQRARYWTMVVRLWVNLREPIMRRQMRDAVGRRNDNNARLNLLRRNLSPKPTLLSGLSVVVAVVLMVALPAMVSRMTISSEMGWESGDPTKCG